MHNSVILMLRDKALVLIVRGLSVQQHYQELTLLIFVRDNAFPWRVDTLNWAALVSEMAPHL